IYPFGDVAPLRIQSFTLCITSSTLPFFKIFTGGTFPTIVKRSPKASRVSPISSQSSTLKEDISNSLKSSQIPLVCPQICKEGLNPVISFIPEVNLFISGKENSINCLWLKISVQVTGSAIDTVAFPNSFVKASTHLKELSTTSYISSFNFSGFFFLSLRNFSTG